MFYEAKEGLTVSLEGVRFVRIGESPAGYFLELLYNDQTAVTIQNSESRVDLLPAYRAILGLLGCRGRCGVIRYCAACGAIEPGEERVDVGTQEPARSMTKICQINMGKGAQEPVTCPLCGMESCRCYVAQTTPQTTP